VLLSSSVAHQLIESRYTWWAFALLLGVVLVVLLGLAGQVRCQGLKRPTGRA
jgi:hypothetical protein